MYLYGNKPVHAWNAVDVQNSDGSLQHGNVIGVLENGLVIDFDCPKQHSDFVEYGRIFNCSDDFEEHWTELDAEVCDVQALIRFRHDAPWVWLPATYLECYSFSHDTACYGYVEIQRNGVVVKELLPYAQIRIRPCAYELKSRRIAQEHFVVRSCALPENYWTRVTSMISIRFKQRVESELSVHLEAVLSETLVYCQRNEDDPIHPVQLETCFRRSKEDVDEYAQQGTEPRWLQLHNSLRTFPKKHQKLQTQPHVQFPPVILAEIFEYLDTISRIRCRRTCPTWNFVLTEVKYKDLGVYVNEDSFTSPLSDYDWNPLYAVTGCFLKCFTEKSTERIIIRDMKAPDREEVLPLIQRLLKDTNKPVKQLIFCDSEFGGDCSNMVDNLEELFNHCSNIKNFCGNLVWKNCRFTIENLVVFVSYASISLNGDCPRSNIWNMLEQNMLSPDIEGMSEWITQASDATKLDISGVLNHYQGWDPRGVAHYGDRRWTPDKLHNLEPGKLTKATLCMLHQMRSV